GPPRPPLAAAVSQSNQTAEAFEEVAPGDIEQALERQRVQGENGGGSVVRASVANLVVVTPTRAAGQRALAALALQRLLDVAGGDLLERLGGLVRHGRRQRRPGRPRAISSSAALGPQLPAS
ncbi:MAG TPA: hypothetical protein VFW32_06915, partial [Actinomycetes bacterium]|nr:hypothetical protein [Actinomycetes bacterium]